MQFVKFSLKLGDLHAGLVHSSPESKALSTRGYRGRGSLAHG